MTGSSNSRSRGLGAMVSALAFGAYLMLSAVPAQAVSTCLYDAVNKEVNVTATGAGTDTLLVGAGGAIQLNAVQCGVATVNNTDGINADLSGFAINLFIDLGGGHFAPGESPEASGTAEIEIDILNQGDDTISFEGTSGDDSLVFGDGGVANGAAANLNGDADADVTWNALSLDDLFISGNDGNDLIDLRGGSGTGSFFVLANGGGPTGYLGDAGDDTIFTGDASAAELLVNGGEGNDHLVGGAGVELLSDTGTLQDVNGVGGITCDEDELDVLEGGADGDILNAGTGDDTLRGGQGDDDENGQACSDLFDEEDGPNGADEFDGDSGIAPLGVDEVSYAGRNSDVNADNAGDGDEDDGEFGETDDIYSDVENMTGGEGDDTISSAVANQENVLDGGPGDDALSGGDGDDTLIGGPGDDAYDGGTEDTTIPADTADFSGSPAGVTADIDAGTATGEGNDTLAEIESLTGSAFGDTLLGDEDPNLIFAGAGNDTLDARGDFDGSHGQDGDDVITDTGTEANENDTGTGGSGNDTIDVGVGNDLAFGDDSNAATPDGNDTIEGGEGDDTLDGQGGDDTITDSGTTNENNDDSLSGGDGNDSLTSDEGNDLFDGDDGDVLGDGNDTMVSGADDDFASGDGGNDTFADTGADDGGDLDSDDEFFGGGNDDTAHLGQGDDLGVGDDDCLAQEPPPDNQDAAGSKRVLNGNVTPGDDQLFGEDGDDELHGCENDDLLEGGNGDDEIFGGDDTDQIRGQAGEDEIEGDTGNDNVSGGPDDDDMDGGEGADTLSFKQCGQAPAAPGDSNCQTGGVEADALLGFAVGEGNDVIFSFEILVGSAFDDILTGGGGTVATNFRLKGGAGADVLTGSGSNDTIAGAKGDDVLRGGGGDDTMKGGKGSDEGFGGRGTDFCASVETPHSCEIFG